MNPAGSSTSDSQKDYPTCSTCKHFNPYLFDNMSSGSQHHCARVELYVHTYEADSYSFQPPSPSFGCLLHSDLQP